VGDGCSTVTVTVANNDFDPNRGHELDLMIAGAYAAIRVGADGFTVSSFSYGNRGSTTAHNRGDAMDISAIDGIAVAASPMLGGYLRGYMSNTSVPIGSQIMAPGYFGYNKVAGAAWRGIDMHETDPRPDSPHYGETWGYMHRHHIHVTWGPGASVPEY